VIAERLTALRFEVPGIPITQGATNPAQVADYPRLMEWRDSITVLARAARQGRWPTVVPPQCVTVLATFRLPPTKTGQWVGAEFPGGSKDLDKLQRALGDAMETAGVYRDDAQIVEWAATKRWASAEFPAGVEVVVLIADPRVDPITGTTSPAVRR
jgi:Holliday junction resolvase RusA-like endonuclease